MNSRFAFLAPFLVAVVSQVSPPPVVGAVTVTVQVTPMGNMSAEHNGFHTTGVSGVFQINVVPSSAYNGQDAAWGGSLDQSFQNPPSEGSFITRAVAAWADVVDDDDYNWHGSELKSWWGGCSATPGFWRGRNAADEPESTAIYKSVPIEVTCGCTIAHPP